MRTLYYQNRSVYLSRQYMLEKGINPETVKQLFKRYADEVIEFEGVSYLNYNSIPTPTRSKLPSYGALLGEHDAQAFSEAVEELFEKLEYARTKNFGQYVPKVRDIAHFLPNKVGGFAQKWAVWEWILANYTNKKGYREALFGAYKRLEINTFENINGFSNYLTKCKKHGVEAVIIDRRKFNAAPLQISAENKLWVQMLLSCDKKIPITKIHKKIIAACADAGIDPPSYSWVRDSVKELLKNPVLTTIRYGKAATGKKTQYISREYALYANDQWQCDSWELPFYGPNLVRYMLFLAWDNHSGKIVGFSVGKSENTPLIMEGIDDAIRSTGYIAYEFVMDNHSFHRTAVAARFKAEAEKLGVRFTVTMNPQYKSIAETGNKYLDAICREYEGWTGQNRNARNKDAHRNPETYAQLRKPCNEKTEGEIKAIAAAVVLEYNSTILKRLGKSPNEAYAASEVKHGIPLTTEQRIQLIKPCAEYTVSRGQITIQVGIVRHEFQLNSDMAAMLEGEKVVVQYEDLRDGIYLYSVETGEPLGSVGPKVKIHGDLANQTEKDRELILKQHGRKKGIETKGKKKMEEIERSALLANPEAVELIAPYLLDKDLRKQMAQNRDLALRAADMGVNENMLPIRPPKKVAPLKVASQKKKSPFTPTEHKIEIIDRNTLKDL